MKTVVVPAGKIKFPALVIWNGDADVNMVDSNEIVDPEDILILNKRKSETDEGESIITATPLNGKNGTYDISGIDNYAFLPAGYKIELIQDYER